MSTPVSSGGPGGWSPGRLNPPPCHGPGLWEDLAGVRQRAPIPARRSCRRRLDASVTAWMGDAVIRRAQGHCRLISSRIPSGLQPWGQRERPAEISRLLRSTGCQTPRFPRWPRMARQPSSARRWRLSHQKNPWCWARWASSSDPLRSAVGARGYSAARVSCPGRGSPVSLAPWVTPVQRSSGRGRQVSCGGSAPMVPGRCLLF